LQAQQFAQKIAEHEREEDDADLLQDLANWAAEAEHGQAQAEKNREHAEGDFEKRLGRGGGLFFDDQTGETPGEDGGDV